ncbi:MAG: DEAD/DEAH box helicase [Planctomycetes bacterium]|nr:DEAD/DEAH box helicase [Planctomycetota bacterium]
MNTNLGELAENFLPESIAKGAGFFAAKRVSRIEFDPATATIKGIVKEDDNSLIAVQVQVQNGLNDTVEVVGTCECGHRAQCHHISALLIAIGGAESITNFRKDIAEQEAYFQRHPEQRPAAVESPKGTNGSAIMPSPPEAPLPWKIQEWLKQLNGVLELESTGHHTKPAAAGAQIIYIVSALGYIPHTLEITVMKAVTKKNGRPGSPRQIDPFIHNRYIKLAQADDHNIFRMFSGFSPSSEYHQLIISDEYSTLVLEKIVATGRCFFMSHTNSPLTWGPPRPGKADWITESDLIQRTNMTVTPAAAVFRGSPLIYVDTAAHIIGPVITELPTPIAQRWLSAPPIQPRFHNTIAAFSAANELPLPPPVPEAQWFDAPPQPVLKLYSGLDLGMMGFSVHYSDYSGALDGLSAHWANVEFAYGVMRTTTSESETTLDRFIAGQRYCAVRNLALERKRLEELKAAQLRIMEGYGVPVWAMTDNDFESWQKWMDGPMKALAAKGWIIEYDESCKLRRAVVEDWFMDTTVTDASDQKWFNVDLGIIVDGARISLIPILRKILTAEDSSSAYFRKKKLEVQLPDGRYVQLPQERLNRIQDLLLELFAVNADETGPLRADRLRAAQFAGVDGWQWSGSQQVRELLTRLRTASTMVIMPPSGLAATLRPYQQHGLNWLQFLRECDLSGILADDMGLGKTVQALAHLLCEKQAGRLDRPVLVVAPTSLMGNWRQESRRFAPDLRVLVLHGSGRKEHFEKLDQFDLIITSYQLLARDMDFLIKQPYHQVILDEAQMVKNPNTQYAQAARKLITRHRLALTGTPMENHLGELWAIFDFLMPGFLGNNRQFRQLFRDPVEKAGDTARRKALAQRIAPLVLRRRKSEVALELPPKNEMVQEIELSGTQRDLYESIRVTMESHVRNQIANLGLARSHIFILEALLKLRQVCCDPRLVKLASAQKVTQSAKMDWLTQTLPAMIEDGRKILLFSQFTSMLELIAKKLAELKIPYVRLTGDTRDRDTPVQSFQSGKVPLFLISLKAGGTGLNLTAADTVIHYDPWWNPAVENQATDRAHRIGQDKTVFVYKLITQGTVEEKIQALQQRKRQLVAGLLDDTGQIPLQLGDEELKALFAPLG